MSTLLPDQAREKYAKGELEFDHVLTFSSVEHSGLGRYGDALNPWADVQAIGRAWCVTKPAGYMVIMVPSGPDTVQFNAHRSYGKARYPLLTANWKQHYRTSA